MDKVHEFNPVIYPFKLWVVKEGITINEIDEMFDAINDDGYGVSYSDVYKSLLDHGTDATTFIVGHKKQGVKGCLVVMGRKVKIKSLSHEADHCADYLFEDIGDTRRSFDGGEPYAYYQSWVFECLYNVKRGKL